MYIHVLNSHEDENIFLCRVFRLHDVEISYKEKPAFENYFKTRHCKGSTSKE